MSICNKFHREAGMSLIEVMVAILIIGTTFLGLIQAFPYALKIIKSAENKTVASYRAQEKIEELYQAGYDNIGVGTIEAKQDIGGGFERETTVAYLDEDLSASGSDIGLKRADVIVYYINPFSQSEISYRLSTILSDR